MLNKFSKERRDALASVFDETAKVMRVYVETIGRGEEPPPLCFKLEAIVNDMPELTKKILTGKEMDRLASEMLTVCKNWRKLDSSNQANAKTNKRILREIENAAGYFEGNAITLRGK